MRSRRWRSIQSGLLESAHGSPELVKHALLVEVDGMSRNTADAAADSAGAAVPFEELRAGRIRRRTMPEYTAARGQINHATTWKRAEASVQCSGFKANAC